MLVLCLPLLAKAQTSTYTSGSGSYTVPGSSSAFYDLTIQVWGGGGSGGIGGQGIPSGGGGGGGYATISLMAVAGGTVFTYSVGAGGVPFSGVGVSGSTSTVSLAGVPQASASGGLHGDTPSRAGGQPLTGSGYNGGTGAPITNGQGGGGGGSAYTNSNGNPGSGNTGGAGTGNGGNGGVGNTDAQDGTAPGGAGGGRGGGQGNGNGNKVGFGANGQIIISATCATVAPGAPSPASLSLCLGQTASLTLIGHTGSIQWQRKPPSGIFGPISGATSATLDNAPTSVGTWAYRAVVTNACSGTATSSETTVTVAAPNVGGTITGGNTPIFVGQSTGAMTLTNYTGSTFQWTRDGNPVGSNSPNFSGETLSTPGNYTYQVTVTNGICAASTSSTVTIVVQAILPVELTYFEASEMGENVLLQWQTASELNNEAFIIERSADGLSFEPIATVEGKGTTTETSDYHFTDLRPLPGTSYYRLKQVDFNGKYEYSELVSVRRPQTMDVIAYPIPVKDVLNLTLPTRATGTVDIHLFSIQGQLVISKKMEASELFKLDLTMLETGHYLLRLQYDGRVYNTLIMKE